MTTNSAESQATRREHAADVQKALPTHNWSSANHKTTDVTQHLFVVARSTARAAVNLYLSDDHEEVLWAANAVGIALETALKLTLAVVDPVLIADPKSKPGTNLLLAGALNLKFTNKEVKSIGASDAGHLVRQLHKGVASFSQCEVVFDVRNSATHMGIVDTAELEAAVTAMVSVIQGLLEHIGKTADEFWGELASEVVPRIVNEQTTKIQRGIDAKKLRARRYFDRLCADVPKAQLELLLSALEARTEEEVDGEESVREECPVCHRAGVLRRYIEEPSSNYRWYTEPQDPGTGERYAYPDEFECFVCRLELDYDEVGEIEEFEQEAELEPSAEFEDARAEWEQEQEREREREEKREEIREAERARERERDDLEADAFAKDF